MLTKLRASLNHANVTGTLALFLALGGTSYAVATGSIDSRELKNNGVRSKDIRNNDVRSKDVRDRSLLRKDFKPGQLPAGSIGPQGPKGDTGPPGLPPKPRRPRTSSRSRSSTSTSTAVPRKTYSCPGLLRHAIRGRDAADR